MPTLFGLHDGRIATVAIAVVSIIATLIFFCLYLWKCRKKTQTPASEVISAPVVNAGLECTPIYIQPVVESSGLIPCPTSPLPQPGPGVGSSARKLKKTLLQLRRGSNASLMLNLSPLLTQTSNIIKDSPLEDKMLLCSRPLTLVLLLDAVADERQLYEEFCEIPTNIISRKARGEPFTSGTFNRYPDVVPNPRTRVILENNNGDPMLTYINANLIKGYSGSSINYVATEAPLASTVTNFWRMIWQLGSSIIVMLTDIVEQNKEKCYPYWPQTAEDGPRRYGELAVSVCEQQEQDGYQLSLLTVSNTLTGESRPVHHLWYKLWPDHGTPPSTNSFISLVLDTHTLANQSTGPLAIHCSAGRGRTGCFIAVSSCIQQIQNGGVVDIMRVVGTIRLDRGGLVEEQTQYKFIYEAVCNYWTWKVQN